MINRTGTAAFPPSLLNEGLAVNVAREKEIVELKCVQLRWNVEKKANVCRHCGANTKSLYIATGHDHTDDRADLCDCGNGEDFRRFFARVGNTTHPLSDYLPHLTPNA